MAGATFALLWILALVSQVNARPTDIELHRVHMRSKRGPSDGLSLSLLKLRSAGPTTTTPVTSALRRSEATDSEAVLGQLGEAAASLSGSPMDQPVGTNNNNVVKAESHADNEAVGTKLAIHMSKNHPRASKESTKLVGLPTPPDNTRKQNITTTGPSYGEAGRESYGNSSQAAISTDANPRKAGVTHDNEIDIFHGEREPRPRTSSQLPATLTETKNSTQKVKKTAGAAPLANIATPTQAHLETASGATSSLHAVPSNLSKALGSGVLLNGSSHFSTASVMATVHLPQQKPGEVLTTEEDSDYIEVSQPSVNNSTAIGQQVPESGTPVSTSMGKKAYVEPELLDLEDTGTRQLLVQPSTLPTHSKRPTNHQEGVFQVSDASTSPYVVNVTTPAATFHRYLQTDTSISDRKQQTAVISDFFMGSSLPTSNAKGMSLDKSEEKNNAHTALPATKINPTEETLDEATSAGDNAGLEVKATEAGPSMASIPMKATTVEGSTAAWNNSKIYSTQGETLAKTLPTSSGLVSTERKVKQQMITKEDNSRVAEPTSKGTNWNIRPTIEQETHHVVELTENDALNSTPKNAAPTVPNFRTTVNSVDMPAGEAEPSAKTVGIETDKVETTAAVEPTAEKGDIDEGPTTVVVPTTESVDIEADEEEPTTAVEPTTENADVETDKEEPTTVAEATTESVGIETDETEATTVVVRTTESVDIEVDEEEPTTAVEPTTGSVDVETDETEPKTVAEAAAESVGIETDETEPTTVVVPTTESVDIEAGETEPTTAIEPITENIGMLTDEAKLAAEHGNGWLSPGEADTTVNQLPTVQDSTKAHLSNLEAKPTVVEPVMRTGTEQNVATKRDSTVKTEEEMSISVEHVPPEGKNLPSAQEQAVTFLYVCIVAVAVALPLVLYLRSCRRRHQLANAQSQRSLMKMSDDEDDDVIYSQTSRRSYSDRSRGRAGKRGGGTYSILPDEDFETI